MIFFLHGQFTIKKRIRSSNNEVEDKIYVKKKVYCANKVSKHLQMVRFIGTWNSMQKNN